ncbi:MAG: D-alanyl-D-alanine carboxypeptidase [Methylococcales bacterium]|nr:D-alanyl-D-alanine carboxypeptidase [Methylococcales bacterium]
MNTAKKLLHFLIPAWLLLATQVSYGQHAEIIIDAENGNVIHEVSASQAWFPASLTKVMTLYVTFETLRANQIHLHDTLQTSAHAARQPNSKLGLRTGELITVRDAILALITRSANDAAVVLAEGIGGTEENFAVKMTATAHALGMSDTHFMNATGLPHQWQVTTARDLAVLAWKTYHNFPEYYPYFASHNFLFKGRELRAINKFTATYPGAEGMKTGFTCGSGYNLISSANQNGRRLIGVVLGGMTSPQRYQLMINMMNNAFANKFVSAGLNLTSMPTNNPGIPPYQLGCGNMAQSTFKSTEVDETPVVFTPSASPKHVNVSKHRAAIKPAKIVHKTKPVKAPIVVKNNHPTKTLKPVKAVKVVKAVPQHAPAKKINTVTPSKIGKITNKGVVKPHTNNNHYHHS